MHSKAINQDLWNEYGDYDMIGNVPSRKVVEWAELPDDNPILKDGLTCISANDDQHLTFSEIADLIEKNL